MLFSNFYFVSVLPTCTVSLVPGPQQRAGLLVLALLPLPLVLAVVREGVDALVAAGVAVRVVDDHVVGGNRQVNPQLVTGQASLRLRAEQRNLTAAFNKTRCVDSRKSGGSMCSH